MELPRQDMRLIVPALSALAGAWCALRIADWQSLPAWGRAGMVGGVLLLAVSAWLLRGRYRSYAPYVLPAAIVLGVFGVACANITYHHPSALVSAGSARHSHIAQLSGTISSRPEPEKMQWSQGKCSVTVAVEEVQLGENTFRYSSFSLPLFTEVAHQLGYPPHSAFIVQLRSADCSALIGQKVSAEGSLSLLSGDRREGAQLFVSDMSISGEGVWAAQRVRGIQLSLTALLENRPSHVRGLLPGVALGDDTQVSGGLSDAMRMTQLTHLIAVSGGHVSILMGIVFGLVGRKRPVLSAFACLAILSALVVLVGAQASVMRAFLMSIVILLAFARGRSSQATPAWSAAVIVTAIFHPWMALSYGFLLSASATMGIVLLGIPLARHLQRAVDEYAEKISRVLPYRFRYGDVCGRSVRRRTGRVSRAEKITNLVAHGLAIPLAAQIFCTPILLLFTTEGSVWGVCANALVAPVVAPLTVFGLLAALCAPAFPALASLCVYPAQACTWWIDYISHTFAGFYGSGIPVWLAGLVSLCLVGAAICVRRPAIACVLVAPVVLVIGVQWVMQPHSTIPEDWQVIQCDVGQGSALLARVESQVIMVDVGGEDSGVGSCLKEAEVSHIDLLILSHMHDDHIGGLREVLDTVSVGQIWVSPYTEPSENWDMLTRLADAASIPIETVWRGHDWDMSVHILSPREHPSGDPNADSLVVQIDTAGGVLVMGDADGEVQIPIASRVSKSRTIVVAHHGSSRQEEALAQAVNPDIALISVGENSYGHPSESALRVYRSADIYDTRSCGTIALTDTEVFSACTSP